LPCRRRIFFAVAAVVLTKAAIKCPGGGIGRHAPI
jgi:hypothetical protein